MAIEEKQRALEFTFVPDNIDGDLKYDITYDERNELFPLRVSAGGNGMDYPLELLVEIVEFLTSKGVIKPQILSRTIETPGANLDTVSRKLPAGVEPGSFAASLMPPQIVKQDGTTATSSSLTSNTDPLASFDITSRSSVIPESVAEASEPVGSEIPPIPTIVKSGEEGVVMHSPATPAAPSDSTAPSSEMITRPVIRSRVSGVDPQSAEKEAAMLRASSGKGAGKTIRKAHRTEGE